jgi:hypothetical protein
MRKCKGGYKNKEMGEGTTNVFQQRNPKYRLGM